MATNKTKRNKITNYQFQSILKTVTKLKIPEGLDPAQSLFYCYDHNLINIPFKETSTPISEYINVCKERIPILTEFFYGKTNKSTMLNALDSEFDDVFCFVDVFLNPSDAFYFVVSVSYEIEIEHFRRNLTIDTFMVREFENNYIVGAPLKSCLSLSEPE